MNNENRDITIELTDEQVEKVTGGSTFVLPEHGNIEVKTLSDPLAPEGQPIDSLVLEEFYKKQEEELLNNLKPPK